MGRETCKVKASCDGKCAWMKRQIELEKVPRAQETVTIPSKELEIVLFKLFNILLAVERAENGEINFNDLKGIQEQIGHQITTDELFDFGRQYGLDVE